MWQRQLGGVTAVKRGVGLVGPYFYGKELLPAESQEAKGDAKGEKFRPNLRVNFTKEHGCGWSGIWHHRQWNLVGAKKLA